MPTNTLTEEQIRQIIKIAQAMQPIFANQPRGGEGDNSDVIKAIKETAQKNEALSKEDKKLYKKLEEKLGAQNIKKELNTLTDVMRERSDKSEYKKFAIKLNETAKIKFRSQYALEQALKELEESAKKAGTTLKKEGVESFKPLANMNQKQTFIIRDGIKLSEKKIEKVEEEIKAIDETIHSQAELRTAFDKSKATLTKWTGHVKSIGKDFLKFAEQEQRFAQATATADAGWIDGMTKMGISQIDYMKILKDTRHESLAAASAGIDFKASLETSTKSLRGMTSSYTEAAKGAAMFHKNMARIGVSQDDLGDAVNKQTTMYEKNYRALGYTVEEFANLTNELINSQGMRSTLLGLQEDERKAYILSVQQRQAEYLTMGYTIERAKELQKTFQSLNKQNPKERMKAAAKQRAMMGALGLGNEGAELFKLQTQYRTMGPKEKADAEKRMAEINSIAAKKFGKMSGSGASMEQAFAMQMMADKTGFTQIADTFETATGEGLKFDKKQLDVTNEIADYSKAALGLVDYWGAATNSSIGSVATNIAALGVSLLSAKGATALAAKMAGSGGAAGAVTSAVKGAAGFVSNTAGGATAAAAGAMGITKAGAKTALKAIPGIGLLAALGFMTSRLMDGDVLGASLELTSGVLGMMPGFGTAGSLTASAALVAHDVNMASDVPTTAAAINPTTLEPGTQPGTSASAAIPQTDFQMLTTTNEQLLETLKSLDGHLKSSAELSDKNAKSMNKLGQSIEDSSKLAALPGHPSTR